MLNQHSVYVVTETRRPLLTTSGTKLDHPAFIARETDHASFLLYKTSVLTTSRRTKLLIPCALQPGYPTRGCQRVASAVLLGLRPRSKLLNPGSMTFPSMVTCQPVAKFGSYLCASTPAPVSSRRSSHRDLDAEWMTCPMNLDPDMQRLKAHGHRSRQEKKNQLWKRSVGSAARCRMTTIGLWTSPW